jgi:ribosome-associated protein
MKENLSIKNGIAIPEHELDITTSRAGGPGGQHVNKTSSRITVRWNVPNTTALTEEQKKQVIEKLKNQITSDGDIIVHNSSSRSQLHNKKAALLDLAHKIRKALHTHKKRMKTKTPAGVKEARLKEKKSRSSLKKTRRNQFDE